MDRHVGAEPPRRHRDPAPARVGHEALVHLLGRRRLHRAVEAGPVAAPDRAAASPLHGSGHAGGLMPFNAGSHKK